MAAQAINFPASSVAGLVVWPGFPPWMGSKVICTSGMSPSRENQELSSSLPVLLLGCELHPGLCGQRQLLWDDRASGRGASWGSPTRPVLDCLPLDQAGERCKLMRGTSLTAAEPYSNQDSSLGEEFSVWFLWARLLLEPQPSDISALPSIGWTAKFSSHHPLSRHFSGNSLEDWCSQISLELIASRGLHLVLSSITCAFLVSSPDAWSHPYNFLYALHSYEVWNFMGERNSNIF